MNLFDFSSCTSCQHGLTQTRVKPLSIEKIYLKKKNIKKKQNILTEEIFMGGEKGLRKF